MTMAPKPVNLMAAPPETGGGFDASKCETLEPIAPVIDELADDEKTIA